MRIKGISNGPSAILKCIIHFTRVRDIYITVTLWIAGKLWCFFYFILEPWSIGENRDREERIEIRIFRTTP